MVFLSSLFQNASGYLKTIELTDILDIAIVAFLFYQLFRTIRSTNAEKIIKGVACFLVALGISSILHLKVLKFLIGRLVEIGALALIVLFQPEIRRILEQVGSSRLGLRNIFGNTVERPVVEQAIDQVVTACREMSKCRTGVLIVFEREINLDDILRSGTRLDALTSCELLKNIFFINAPMHDGATIIRQGRILGAGCMLPLSKNMNLSRDLGMRHRAGIGMSEHSDAVVVLVSEETGSISCAVGGMLKRHLTSETLSQLLHNELIPQVEEQPQKFSFSNVIKALQNLKGGVQNEDK